MGLRIGFASIYAWRPHVEQAMFLAGLVRQAGHAAVFLACDADLPACYTRELRDTRPDWLECLLCRVGGVRSYTAEDVSSIGSLAPMPPPVGPQALQWASSSASTLGRFESPADYRSEAFAALRDKLAPSVARAHAAAVEWIRRERLDAICLFNGRMDATRAIFEAARAAGVRVVTFERSWFGDGLQLLPDENCLGLRSVDAMVERYDAIPLSLEQARSAASYAAARLTGTNVKEWRAYNQDAVATDWPVAGGDRRILLLPGSLNEFWGHPDWVVGWPDATAAYDALIDHLGLRPHDLLLRCHPNWGERIGKNDGRMAEEHYAGWARARGVRVIGSRERVSTMSLIAECDAVVLASGSAALEASALGKQVISVGASTYQRSALRTDATSPEAMRRLRLHVDLPPADLALAQERLRRASLRFAYTMTHRFPQFVRHARAASTTAYRYLPGADPQRLVDLIVSGELRADDPFEARDPAGEDQVVAWLRAGAWDRLQPPPPEAAPAPHERLRRRWFLRPIDAVRDRMPVGDR